MTQVTHDLIRRFFANLGAGTPEPEMFAPDMVAWTLSTKADSPGEHYIGATKLLASLFPQGLSYQVKAVTAEDDRAVAEVTGSGTLANGEEYRNDYVHVFRIRGGKIARIEEFFDPKPVEEKIIPRLMEAMKAQQAG